MGWLLDLKYSLRTLTKVPSFSLLMLAIIIGSLLITSIGFNFVYTITVKPLDSEIEQSVRMVRHNGNGSHFLNDDAPNPPFSLISISAA
ncbi:hypothetical protein CS022_22145 [Veronia nyctiphanis]|uniref:Uncharacterized protein n=1 Tax=Veronia nyctiphanis TaxID=1278244 RepID=A0A4Q0YK62_9GAMM|nr:hypothetical protein [Veronia nyctiphanis]RXJ70833.1 hypothetical protein CS022_22145 [Veronia nyctiphanis]